jgi:hypothetical protein
MLHLIAIIAFVLAVIFWAWNLVHGVWAWEMFMLLGLTFWCASEHPKNRW